MKAKYLIVCLIGIVLVACKNNSLQEDKNYRPTIVEGYEWRLHIKFNYDPSISATEIQRIEGDSVIGKHTYKKLIAYGPESPGQWKVKALLREDVQEQKIYIWAGDTERIKCDFSMSVGDYAPLYVSDFLDINYRGDVMARLDGITEKADLRGEKFRIFHYTAILNTNGYKDEQPYVLYERFGGYSGVFNMGVMECGGSPGSLQEARDEHGNVILTGEGLPYE